MLRRLLTVFAALWLLALAMPYALGSEARRGTLDETATIRAAEPAPPGAVTLDNSAARAAVHQPGRAPDWVPPLPADRVARPRGTSVELDSRGVTSALGKQRRARLRPRAVRRDAGDPIGA